jgi:hypothetical protein
VHRLFVAYAVHQARSRGRLPAPRLFVGNGFGIGLDVCGPSR